MAEEVTPAAPATVAGTPAAGSNDDDLAGVLKDAQNPDAVKNAIDRQKADAKAARDKAAELEAKLKEYEDRDKTDKEKDAEKLTAAEKRAGESEAKLLRFEVAAAKGVPLTQAHRLQGSTKQELEQDADAFLKDVKSGQQGGQLDGGVRESSTATDDMDTLIRRSAGYA